MSCFECAERNETTAAVAICQCCGVALCFEHLVESTPALVGGTHEGCRYQIPVVAPAVNGRTGRR